jgi:hypothetical protein
MMQELWLPVVGWEGLYEVSSLGRVRSTARTISRLFNGTLGVQRLPSRVRKLQQNGRYLTVRLHGQGRKARTYSVHTLVAEAFLGKQPQGFDVCHGVKGSLCNEASNLHYGTRAENLKDRDRDGTHQRGQQGPGAKLTLEQAREIKRLKGVEPSHVVGARYGISFSAVCMIWRGVTWIDA